MRAMIITGTGLELRDVPIPRPGPDEPRFESGALGVGLAGLRERLKQIGVNKIDEEIESLRNLQILVDGGADHAYMLQIFLKDAAHLQRDKDAGPFFFEVIQRKGDRGFGAGNFRALFESIERQQKTQGRA